MTTSLPIYVINLKRNPERRLHIQRQLDPFGLKYEFVEVDDIDKYELESKAYRMRIAQSLDIDESLLENKYTAIIDHAKTEEDKNWKSANLGQIAIILSHIKIYDSMVKNGIEQACILEDDAVLLPTFPEVLKMAPKLEWDILLLVSQPTNWSYLERLVERKPKFNYLSFLSTAIGSLLSLKSRKRVHQIKQLLEHYSIDSDLYPKQSQRIEQILEEYETKQEEIIKTIISNKLFSPRTESRYFRKTYRILYGPLILHSLIQLGAAPRKTSLQPINENHRIGEPIYIPYSATAYLVNQASAMKWKYAALAPHILAIDQIPWVLYKYRRMKLRVVTPPCAHTTYHYLKYSVRCG